MWMNLDGLQGESLEKWENSAKFEVFICPVVKQGQISVEKFEELGTRGLSEPIIMEYSQEATKKFCQTFVDSEEEANSIISAFDQMVGTGNDRVYEHTGGLRIIQANRLPAFESFEKCKYRMGLGFFETPNYYCENFIFCSQDSPPNSDEKICPDCGAKKSVGNPGSRDWLPEINLVATVERSSFKDLQSFIETLEQIRIEAFQHSLLVVLSDGTVWQLLEGAQIVSKGDARKWTFTNSANESWTQQIALRIQKSLLEIDSELFEIEMNQADGGLGATFFCSPIKGDEKQLEVMIAGSSNFFSQTCFPAVLASFKEDLPIDSPKLILVDVVHNGTSSPIDLFYAFPQQEADLHCYCGRCYPVRSKEFCRVDQIPSLRLPAADWIKVKYEKGANVPHEKASWGMLSSPHTFTVETLPKNKKEDDAAKHTAQCKWNSLRSEGLI